MIKIILLLILFVSSSFAQNANEFTNATIAPGLSSSRNYVKNPSGFKNTLGITVSSATIARDTDTADKLDGIASLVCDASSQNGYCLWSLDTIQEGDKTGNCEFKVTYKGDASLYKLRITDTSSTLTDSSVLANVTDWTEASINYPCGSARDVRLVQTESGTGAAVNIGRVYYGKATNIGGAAQAKLVLKAGRITSAQTISASTATKLQFNSAITDPFSQFDSTTNYRFTSKERGEFIVTGSIYLSSTLSESFSVSTYKNGAEVCQNWIIASNANTSIPITGCQMSLVPGDYVEWYVDSTTDTSYDFRETSAYSFVSIIKLPSLSEQTVGLSCVGTANCENVFSATVGSTGTVSAENVDWINGNCTNANPLVCTFNTSLFSAVPSCTATAVSGRIVNFTALSTSSISVQGVDDAGSATQYGFHLICSRQSSDLKPRPQVPILVGSVSSTSANGAERIERFSSTSSDCSASPCTIDYKSDGISSVTRSGTGAYTINFVSGTFSSAPTCIPNHIRGGSIICSINGQPSTSSAAMTCYNDAGTSADTRPTAICMGPR